MNKLFKNVLDKLANFTPTDFPFISLYLNTQANQHGRDDFASFVRKEFSEKAKEFNEDSAKLKSFENVRKRINEFLNENVRPSANGIGIFASTGADNFFKVIQFDAPINKHSMHVTNRPHLYPLARIIDQNPRHIALVADTSEARLFVFDPGVTKSIQLIKNSDASAQPNRESSKLQNQQWVENRRLLHAKNIVSRLEMVAKNEEIDHIILAGDDVIIPLLVSQMPQDLADKLVENIRLDIRTPEHEVLKATTKALFDHNIQTDAENVTELFDKYRAGRLAVAGLDDTLDALLKGQVDELLLSASLKSISSKPEEILKVPSISGVRDTFVAVDGHNSSANIADRLVSQALLTNASINFIEDPLLLSEIGGVGALLRYKDSGLDESTVGQNMKAEFSYNR
ncbi:MAG: hypothetical protein R2681_07905 [Pyrinomonadaceae bacterium]